MSPRHLARTEPGFSRRRRKHLGTLTPEKVDLYQCLAEGELGHNVRLIAPAGLALGCEKVARPSSPLTPASMPVPMLSLVECPAR